MNKFKMWKTLLILLAIWISTVSADGAVDEYVHPHYTYSCEEDKSIIVRGINSGGKVWILDGNCLYKELVVNTSSQVSINGTCLTNYTTQTKGVLIRIWDANHDRKTSPQPPTGTSTTPSSTPVIVGGHHSHDFKLICDEIADTGVNRVAERQMHLKDVEDKQGEEFEVYMVKMTFRKTSDISSEELSRIYTGDEFFMFLKYTGSKENNYKVMPKTCSAVKGYNVDMSTMENKNNVVQLWNHTECRSSKALDQEIMEKFEFFEDYARVKMYGFHFSGSNFVSIVCHVIVCPESSKKDTCKAPASNINTSDCFTPTSTIAPNTDSGKTPSPPSNTANPHTKKRIQKRNFETMDRKPLFDTQQQFNKNHDISMQHVNGREKRSAESTIKNAVVYKTINVIDFKTSGAGASFITHLITTFLSFILMKLLM